MEEGGERRPAEQLAAAGSRELEASRRALATLAGRTTRIVSEVSAYLISVNSMIETGACRSHLVRHGASVSHTHTHTSQSYFVSPSRMTACGMTCEVHNVFSPLYKVVLLKHNPHAHVRIVTCPRPAVPVGLQLAYRSGLQLASGGAGVVEQSECWCVTATENYTLLTRRKTGCRFMPFAPRA